MITYKEAIEELKRRYHNNEVSALVGAGFSKNIYGAFPSWDELLHDMIMELYRPEIKKSFQYQPEKGGCQKKEYATHCQRKIKEITNREGYLGIVSRFIEKKGFREAVEVYIEQRIPHVNETTSTLSLLKDKQEISLKDNDFDAHTKLLEGAWDNIYTTNYDHLLEFSAKRAGKQWNTIKRAQDLSFSKQAKAIIKLHGDLCRPDEHSFEFDGNCHQRYVISQEDYTEYPGKHEAFTQLMRISLLQGTFCLFGFSGNDPNFTSWLHWVRDILVMQREEGKEQPAGRIKIFLIDMTAKRPSADKQLFYNNHHIFHIPLLSEEVRALLGVSVNCSPKDLIVRFLTHLYDQDSNNYQRLWSKVFSSLITNKTSPWQREIIVDELMLQAINRLKPSNRIVVDIHRQEYFLHEIYMQKELSMDEIDLMLSALEDTYYQPEYFPKLMKTLDNGPAITPLQQERLQKQYERSATLHAAAPREEADGDYYQYEQILRLAFRLDFTGLHKALSAWEPQDGVYRMKRALFMAFFDKEEAKNQLLAYIDQTLEIKEQYYATELLNLIEQQFPQRYSTAKYENQNLKGLYDLEKVFVKKATLTEEATKPYGCQQKSRRIGQENSRYEASVRVLQLLIEAPICTAYNGTYTLNANDWYKIFLSIFEPFPYPALFYSLQYNTEDVLRRIGQEYAYSDQTQQILPDLLQKLLEMYNNPDTPKWMKSNALVVARELLVAVKPSEWEEQFMSIWTTHIVPYYETWATHDQEFKFTCKGLQYLRSKTHTTQIIKDCLEQTPNNRDTSIEFLYYLKKKHKSEALSEPINRFIRQMDNAGDFVVIGNIYEVLFPIHIQQLAVTMKEIINKQEHIPEYSFRALAYFSYQSKQNQDLVKQAILNSGYLWNNGLLKDGATAPVFIELSHLKRTICWTKEEQERIYRKLKESFRALVGSRWFQESEEHIFSFHYNELLKEMDAFLKDYAKGLSAQEDYPTLQEEIHKALRQEQGFTDICEALVSDESNLVIRGTNQMYKEFPKLHQAADSKDFDLLIDRIVFKRKEGLTGCLSLLAYYMKTKNLKDSLSSTQLERISLIPHLYTSAVLRQLDMELPSATRHIADIAEALKKAGYDSDAIKRWVDIKKSHRFNTF